MKKDRLFTSLLVAMLLATTNIGSASERTVIGEGESLNINEMTFENLETEEFGGAIENSGILSIDGSNFRNNSALKTNTDSSETYSETYATGSGGAIYNAVNAELSVNNSTFENNSSENGGAIYNEGTIKEIVSATFTGNRALNEITSISNYTRDDNGINITQDNTIISHSGSGGAIYNKNGDLNISDSHFENNVAAYGGAIFHDESDTNGILNIKNSKFINNSSYNDDSESGTLTVGDKTYTWNNNLYGLGSGGAIVSYKDTNIEDSQFIGNTTGGDGGAIYAAGNLTVKNSTFKNNIAKSHNEATYYYYENGEVIKNKIDYNDGYGGAISHGNGNLIIEHSTFENNISGDEGGGAISSGGNINITDSIFNSNSTSGNGGAISSIYHNDNPDNENIITISNSEFNENIVKPEEYSIVFGENNEQYPKAGGGAINTDAKELNITNSKFNNNSVDLSAKNFNSEQIATYSGFGGAINAKGNVSITDSEFKGNKVIVKYIDNYDYTSENGYRDQTVSIGEAGNGGAINNTGELTVTGSKFIENNAAYGGAINNIGTTVIKNSEFTGNVSNSLVTSNSTYTYKDQEYKINNDTWYNGHGGVISSDGDLTIENSTFSNNIAAEAGGAIDSYNGNVTIKNSIFNNNIAKSESKEGYYSVDENDKLVFNDESYIDGYGGAILVSNSEGQKLLVEDSEFNGNISGSDGGGAISLAGSFNGNTEINNSKFNSNSTLGTGGALDSYGINNINNSEFKSNTAKVEGGAISHIGELNIDNSTFTGNTTSGRGGAIFGVDRIIVNNSTFKDNIAKPDTDTNETNAGGAIMTFVDYKGEYPTIPYNNESTDDPSEGTPAPVLLVDNSNFENNISGIGGAIYTNVPEEISNSSFKNNKAEFSGGAIYADASVQTTNSTFENNSANDKGGAIYGKAMTLTDTDFINNTAKTGGAIHSAWPDEYKDIVSAAEELGINAGIHITALNKDVKFSGNKADKGSDIYMENNQLYLNANENKTISFDGGIVGKNSSIIINDQAKELYDNMTSVGKIVINNFVSPDKNSSLAINHKAGTLALTNEKYLDGTDLTLEEGSTLDLTNKSVGTMNLNSLTSNNANLNIDADLASSENVFDMINAKTASGTLNLKNVNLISDFSDSQNEFTVTLPIQEGFELKVPENGISTTTKDYVYNIDTTDGKFSVNRLVDDEGNAIKTDGFTVAVNQTDKIGGVDVELSQDRSFSAGEDIKITENNSAKGWTGNLGGKSLTINGNGYTLDGEKNTGIAIYDKQTLTFNDTNIKGFETSKDRKGVLTVNDGGSLNINAVNYDVSLGKNSDSDIIYLDGTTSFANLLTENEKEINVNGNIISANKSNNLKLAGDGKITFNGIVDPVTLTNENEETVHNNYIDDVTYNLNSGMVTFTKDEYLNGHGNKNTLNFNGGTLNIANGAVGTINLAALNINSNSNIMVDADLAKETMDRFTADSATAAKDAILNVSHINLLSDAVKDTVEINAVAPAITLGENDTLASHIATSVKEVAYSPIYKYGGGYDPTTGNFTFSRGSSKDYNNVNPSIMVSPVAAQLGGYMGMIDTYNNAFSNMDMRMLLPSTVRVAQKNANKYAITDTKGADFTTNETNSDGTWVRPFAAYDSVGLKNGPKVHNMSYGSFIGGDTAVHQFANGAEGVLSAHVSYLGSHQSFAGNSIYQNGGNIGLTGTLYKGNFFSGLSLNTGASVADASTMYGNEDFPMFMAGIANKTGYNIEFKEGKFIIQPSLLLSYTFVNTFNYTNASGVKIDGDPLHALQISPNVRFALNTKNGWQPYLTAGMNWNIMNSSEFMANAAELPSLSVKPYVQYGFGLQKTVNDNFTAYAQVLLRNGGRNGIAANAGMKYLFGHESRLKENI